jgi:hypothetical protein
MREQGMIGLDGAVRPDPFADTVFGVVTIVIFAIALLLPTMEAESRIERQRNEALTRLLVDRPVIAGGAPALVILATSRGVELSVGGAVSRRIPLSAILDDRPLAAALTEVRSTGRKLLLAIAPAGEEAAFLLEGVIFRHGPPQLLQIRLDRHCAFLRDRFRAKQCPAQTSSGPS